MRSTMNGAQEFLPGFENIEAGCLLASSMSDFEIDRRFPANTGANLKSTNPRLYHTAARLFFQFGFSLREIAVICQISRQTVSGIIEAEEGYFSARTQQKARLNRIRRLQAQTFANLEGLMADRDAVRRAGPVAIANVYKMLADEAGVLEASLAKDVIEPADQREDASNLKYLTE